MKKLIAAWLTAVSLSSFAQQTVPIVWPFAPGSNQANFYRAIAEEANRQQTRYRFVFDNKPGAGGVVAAQAVQNYSGLSLLSGSPTFFIRPFFYPNESYNVNDFQPVHIQCVDAPFAVVSSKYSSVEQLRNQKQLTIGMSVGSLTEAIARQLQASLPDTELIFVSYANTQQPTIELVAGRLDLNIDLASFVQQWSVTEKLHVIGITGSMDYPGLRSFTGQGVRGFESLVINYQIVVPAGVKTEVVEELHGILRKAAAGSATLSKLYASDYCRAADLSFKQTVDTYNRWQKFWPEKLQSLKK